jgi:hypothetical protein
MPDTKSENRAKPRQPTTADSSATPPDVSTEPAHRTIANRAHPHRGKRQRRGVTHEAALPRVGFDRVIFSVRGLWETGETIPAMLKRLFPGSRATEHKAPPESGYDRIVKCRTPGAPSLPELEILHTPVKPYRPPLRIVVRAPSVSHPLTVAALTQVEKQLSTAFPALRVAELELAIDFPPSVDPVAICWALYVPRVRCAHHNDHWGSGIWGSRYSARFVRVYCKPEHGIVVTRLELVLRRSALRRLGISSATDLRAVPWAAVVQKSIRLLEFRPGTRRSRRPPWFGDLLYDAYGVQRALRRSSARDRRWLRRHLHPAPRQAEVIAAVQRFEDECAGRTGRVDTPRESIAPKPPKRRARKPKRR